ncbi:hypothetical protein VPH35_114848 [Triticum aestivum]
MAQIIISAAIVAPIAAAELVLLLMLLSAGASAAAAGDPGPATIGMPNCVTSCGGVDVPYPFGLGPDPSCYLPGFNLTCDTTGGDARLLLDGDATLQVMSIEFSSLMAQHNGDIKIDFDADGNGKGTFSTGLWDDEDGPYTLSSWNELILTGCNVQATVKSGNVTLASCTSLCQGLRPAARMTPDAVVECSGGTGCCRADIVMDPFAPGDQEAKVYRSSSMSDYDVQLTSLGLGNRSADMERFPVHVFIANHGWFQNTSVYNDMLQAGQQMAVPVSFDWEIVGNHSFCDGNRIERMKTRRGGYFCTCKRGYQGGNLYLPGGCKDDNECEWSPSKSGCYGECINTEGSFMCRCPPGTTGNHAIPDGCYAISANRGSCLASCGDVDVPYPFGIGLDANCYLPGFNLTCDTTVDPPRLLLGSTDFRVVSISLANSTVRVIRKDALVSGNSIQGFPVSLVFGGPVGKQSGDFPFFFSGEEPYSLSTRNELVVTGCNTQATLLGHGNPDIISGCASFCFDRSVSSSTGLGGSGGGKYCHGMGCCQTRISETMDGMPRRLLFNMFINNLEDPIPLPEYVFVTEEGWFEQQGDLIMQNRTSVVGLEVPILLEWEVLHNGSSANVSSRGDCSGDVARHLCKSKFSHCKRRNRGYSCHCNIGYNGNPYVSNGCKGISIIIGVASGAGLILLVLIAYFISYKFKHQRAQMLKRKFFEQNRGQLLQQLISQKADIAERMIITLEELEKATNNFDKARELGILSDLHVVAIKKPKMVVQKEIDEFINEVAILSQINHRNVVKLYGCCLETEVPLLVYEFISNGTLYDHLHVEGPISLSWNVRLRIAIETAKSLAYLHSMALIPIIHRDVKSANILLNDNLEAKVADFGASRYIPLDKSGLTTMVQGTLGYLDPMYFYTGRLTDKSDVYSFGVMLIELMTRKRPFSYMASGDGLVVHFATLFAEGNLLRILDLQVISEGGNTIEEIAEIAVACVKLRGDERPTMRQVELRLEGVQPLEEHVALVVDESEVNCVATN